jgi:ABC-2 type transport system permease protein
MSTLSYGFTDASTMLRRNLRHVQRYPATMIVSLGLPIMLLLLFVGVFGNALNAGLGGTQGGDYIDYVLPGILLMTIGYGSSSTSLAVNRDSTEGIITRFRVMAISRSSVLTGHVVAAMLRTLVSLVLVVGFSFLLGFRPDAGVAEWFGIAGVIMLFTLALSWLAVAVGLAARNAEGTTTFALIVQVLPFVSSAFVTPDSMSGAVRWFAENEPFTPVIDTVRGLLQGTPVGNSAVIAVAWCVVLTVVGYVWARSVFRRDPVR